LRGASLWTGVHIADPRSAGLSGSPPPRQASSGDCRSARHDRTRTIVDSPNWRVSLPFPTTGEAPMLPHFLSMLTAKALSPPLTTLHWDITKACNARCVFCLNNAGLRQRDELSADERVFLVRHAAAIGVRFIRLLGGEPFITPDSLAVIETAASHGIQVSLSTNGSSSHKRDRATPRRKSSMASVSSS